jgi:hypothetical protein
MNADLRHFLQRLAGVVLVTLAPVVFTSFVSMPLSLERHPGELAQASPDAPQRHMS